MKRRFIALVALLFSLPAWAQQVPINRPTLNSSATIATGNTFQQVLAAVSNTAGRKALTIQNNNTNGDNCWIFVGATASATKATSILLGQGGSYQRYYPFVPSDVIAATCTTTNDTLYIDTQ